MELLGRRVLITGASRGIGAALARHFAEAGATPALVARTADALAALAAETKGTAHAADLADRGQVNGLLDRVEDEAGPVDILVNNAGIDGAGWFFSTDPDDVAELMQVNLLSAMELCRQAVPRMLARGGGRIVNVSSLSGVGAFPGLAGYAASKAGLSHFSAGLRADLRGLPVGVTLVETGKVVPTAMSDRIDVYRPTADAFRRFEKLRLLADVHVDKVGAAVVDAVRRDKGHVRLPKRAAGFGAMVEAPRRVTELLLGGVRHREKDD